MVKAARINNQVVVTKSIAPFCNHYIRIPGLFDFPHRFDHILRSQKLAMFKIDHFACLAASTTSVVCITR